MNHKQLIALVLLASVSTSAPSIAKDRISSPVGSDLAHWCEPVLPILEQAVTTDIEPTGIHSCDVLNSPDVWNSFCTSNNLDCVDYGSEFFENWTIVAVAVDTESPVLCENAGPVPDWKVACIVSRHSISVRVTDRLAGSGCQCTMGPQVAVRLFLVNAIAKTDINGCRARRELHTIECLFP